MRIVETDNYDGDYPDEKNVNLYGMKKEHAEVVAKAINAGYPKDYPRYWKVVSDNYELKLGFEP